MKKYISTVLASTLILSSVLPTIAHGEEFKENEVVNVQKENETVNEVSLNLDDVKKYIKVDNNGHIGFTFVPPGQYKKHNLSELQNHFNLLNEKVDNGEIIIKEDLEITDLSPQALAVYGSWTYHWWGYDRKFTKKQAVAYVDEIEYVILGMGAGAAVTAPSLVIAGGFLLSASWYGLLAKRIEANNKGKNGVLIEIYWARTFDITPL
ncbi:hypothetical protein AEA09_18935 [Lysinibacillus contaminans]|uniref:Uncharacterized protein n=1 Tax=Lysinibacillus contaminans TaxID=1293441 RepID=A0ABR5JVW2_9BACI|nr:hypothetical protein [Lysinibacillus contaminans]KOS66291.1 hypothetical protein AEA09_18935 [Lysinibacillus contaminans]